MRRIMVEHGEAFWKERWQPLYSFLGGNPLAAMPSLHFATSLMAARVLAEAGPVEGAVGWTYALTLGFALVYLGEHYVVDLLGGPTLAKGCGGLRRRLRPLRARCQGACSDWRRWRTYDGTTARLFRTSQRRRQRRSGRTTTKRCPEMGITRGRALLFGLFVVSAIAFLYFVLPQLGDVKDTWGKLDEGDPYWLAVAFGFQLLSTASYIAVFQGVHVPPGYPIRFRESYQITMAGLAATRLFAAGGAGGVALTAWALRRSGMPRGGRSPSA